MANITMQDLERQLAELKRQNAALKANGANGKPFKVEVGEYNGNPTLAFSGSFKPWRKGARSIAALFQNAEAVKKALAECGIEV